MTKTLTEQFLYGQLLDGYWYINIDGHEDILEVEKGKAYIGGALVARAFMGDKIDKIEVLSAVPSYDECCLLTKKAERADYLDEKLKYYTPEEYLIIKGLRKKLEIATKALKRYKDKQNWDIRGVAFMKYNKGFTIARKALKEMEGVG